MAKTIYVLGGAPASGKGTQADLLEKELDVKLIKAGVILRHEAAKGTKRGKALDKYMRRGELAPNDLVNELVFERLIRAKKDVMFDGFPRDIEQACELFEIVKERGYKLVVIEIQVTNETIMERITGRRTCDCGETYHVKFNPPKKNGVCDEDGKKLYIRDDEKPAVVRKRIKIYKDKTAKALEFFRSLKQVKYIQVGGNASIKVVHKNILKKLK